ncbi:hypothetical protein C6A87_000570 [Mycobacterium sp. ITM-2016-00317]|uniref:hypothetical protein n=1 Tax=Mycobacterium sp. ITM-2016-00317 TaxID=2099694 RepID=UPI00287FB52C|nr:hypothetical protein [Mycobacterium sp. ITM-2016-00317]WNG87823.1 hypothetical protein C6A87_000570 [Mycobacterium sp. ITM-2016-00317]
MTTARPADIAADQRFESVVYVVELRCRQIAFGLPFAGASERLLQIGTVSPQRPELGPLDTDEGKQWEFHCRSHEAHL